MELRVDRDTSAGGTRVLAGPALVAPLESTIVTLDGTRLDRAAIAVVPARTAHVLELPARGAIAVATLVLDDATRVAAVRDYAPYIDARRFVDVLAAPRILPRTRWVDELVQRYIFEREVCAKPGSRAARFLEAELTKEVYFLGCEQLDPAHADLGAARGRVGRGAGARMDRGAPVRAVPDRGARRDVRRVGVDGAARVPQGAGVAPVVYLRRRRLEEAMQLLETGRYAVTEVATRVGYDNPSAFAAAFREQFGVSPSRVRSALDPAALLPAHGAPPTTGSRARQRPASSARASRRARPARAAPRRRRARASSRD